MEATTTLADIERRLETCESEIKEVQNKQKETEIEQAKINTKLDNILVTQGEIKSAVEALKARPAQWWDKLIAGIIGALAAALITYILKGGF